MTPAEKKLVGAMRTWRESPATMVRELFGVEPDAWQADVLHKFTTTPRIALLASKGVGKTTMLAWLVWNFLLTRPNPKIACISISGDNLRDNLWSDLALWAGKDKSGLIKALFTITKTRIFSNQHPDTWWASARSWSQGADRAQQASALSGLHSPYIMFIIDESGSMPDGILASAENALSTCTEGHIVQAGNPEKLEGPLYRAYKAQHLWEVVSINGDPDNPKRSPRVSVEWAREMIKEWGRDSDYTKINIFGEFPSSSLNALIGPEEVELAMRRFYREYEYSSSPKLMGVDVARDGADASVISKRQGLQMFNFIKRRGLDSNQGASLVAREWDSWGAQACFVDATGGFGFGWIDQLANLGKTAIGVKYSAMAHNPERYANKRAEMAMDFVHWIKRGGALPDSPELLAALTRTTYTFKKDCLILEPKEMVKAKLGYSPDEFDASIQLFAEPVTANVQQRSATPRSAVGGANYNPFADLDSMGGVSSSSPHGAYNPFSSGN